VHFGSRCARSPLDAARSQPAEIGGFSNDAMLLGVRHVCSQVPEKRCDKNLEMLKYVETGGGKFR